MRIDLIRLIDLISKRFKSLSLEFKNYLGQLDKLEIRNSQSAFTLIEAVVATSVFAFMIVSILGVYVSSIQLDRKSRSQRAVAQNSRFIMEYLAKEVRNGTISYANTNDATNLYLENQFKEIEHFFKSGNNLILNKNGADTNLNSSGVKVTSLQFYIRPETDPYLSIGTANEQPHVTIVLGLASDSGAAEVTKLDLQSTFATRAYPSRLSE